MGKSKATAADKVAFFEAWDARQPADQLLPKFLELNAKESWCPPRPTANSWIVQRDGRKARKIEPEDREEAKQQVFAAWKKRDSDNVAAFYRTHQHQPWCPSSTTLDSWLTEIKGPGPRSGGHISNKLSFLAAHAAKPASVSLAQFVENNKTEPWCPPYPTAARWLRPTDGKEDVDFLEKWAKRPLAQSLRQFVKEHQNESWCLPYHTAQTIVNSIEVQSLMDGQHLSSNESNTLYTCSHPACENNSWTTSAFEKHQEAHARIERSREQISARPSNTFAVGSEIWPCQVQDCGYIACSQAALVAHFRQLHQHSRRHITSNVYSEDDISIIRSKLSAFRSRLLAGGSPPQATYDAFKLYLQFLKNQNLHFVVLEEFPELKEFPTPEEDCQLSANLPAPTYKMIVELRALPELTTDESVVRAGEICQNRMPESVDLDDVVSHFASNDYATSNESKTFGTKDYHTNIEIAISTDYDKQHRDPLSEEQRREVLQAQVNVLPPSAAADLVMQYLQGYRVELSGNIANTTHPSQGQPTEGEFEMQPATLSIADAIDVELQRLHQYSLL